MSARPPDGERTADAGRAVPTLTLYAREGCHLCEDMEATLGELFAPGSFVLERVDIDDDAALRARYHTAVPVLADGQLELCRHFLDPLAVGERLASYNGDRVRR